MNENIRNNKIDIKTMAGKWGFKYEGTLRMASQIHDGRIYDDVCYSITKDEWLTEKKKNN